MQLKNLVARLVANQIIFYSEKVVYKCICKWGEDVTKYLLNNNLRNSFMNLVLECGEARWKTCAQHEWRNLNLLLNTTSYVHKVLFPKVNIEIYFKVLNNRLLHHPLMSMWNYNIKVFQTKDCYLVSVWAGAGRHIPIIVHPCQLKYCLINFDDISKYTMTKVYSYHISNNSHIIPTTWICHVDIQQQCLCSIQCKYKNLPRLVPHVLKEK